MKISCRLPSRFLTVILFLSVASLPLPLLGRGRVQGWCEQGNQQVTTPGSQSSTTRVQRSYPACIVNVYSPGTTTHVSIYSDITGTALGNPFTAAASTGYWFFYSDGDVDVNLSGSSISPPFTLGSLPAVSTIPDSLFQTFSVACTTAFNDGLTLVVSKAWTALPTQTCAADLSFVSGGYLQPASGQLVTLTGALVAPDIRIVDRSLGGTVRLPRKIQSASPYWFGALFDGTTDDSAAITATFTALNGPGVVAFPVNATTIVTGTNTITITIGGILELNGSKITDTGTGYAITPIIASNVYATNVIVRNGQIRSSAGAAGGCAKWTASASVMQNIQCTTTALHAVGILVPGDANGTGPYENVFDNVSVQGQAGVDTTSFGFLFTCATTRCPNTNVIKSGRVGQMGTGYFITGEGNKLSEFIAEGNHLWAVDIGPTSKSIRTQIGLSSLSGEGATNPGAINIEAGALDTVILFPRSTGFGSGSWLTDNGTNTSKLGVDTGPGGFVYSLPTLTAQNLTTGVTCATSGKLVDCTTIPVPGLGTTPVCGIANVLTACYPLVMTYDATVTWNSGVGNTSPFYVPFSGGSGPFAADVSAETPAIPDRLYLPTFHYAAVYLSATSAVDLVVTLTENGTPVSFGCTVTAGALGCFTTTPFTKSSTTSGLSWKVSWTGATLTTTGRLSILTSGY